MASDYAILAKLGGFAGSNREIVSSYPPYNTVGNEADLLNTCFPIGAKEGNFCENKFRKYLVLSYIFRIHQSMARDDLFSFAILLHKRDKVEIYKSVLVELINILDSNGRLCEDILTEHHQKIYDGINSELDIYIEDLLIDFSRIFKEVKARIIKEKPQLRGSFI